LILARPSRKRSGRAIRDKAGRAILSTKNYLFVKPINQLLINYSTKPAFLLLSLALHTQRAESFLKRLFYALSRANWFKSKILKINLFALAKNPVNPKIMESCLRKLSKAKQI
jgi:hypothetical protein